VVIGLVEKIERNIQIHHLLRRGQSVLIAVSGGLDSMVLLHSLHRMAKARAWALIVAHFNHQLRGKTSDADEAFVRRTAESLGLPFVSESASVKQDAQEQGISIEMAARKLRHNFLARAADGCEINTVALAHHADDQVELFFLRLFRGSGGEGLAGMDWTNPSSSDTTVRLIRPLLDVAKAELQAFAEQEGISFRQDATNLQLDHARNRIRNELLPLLEEKYQPALARTTLRLMEILREEADFAGQAAAHWRGSKRRRPFHRLHGAVQRRLMQIELLELGVVPNFDLIEGLRHTADQEIMVNPELVVWRDSTGILRSRSVQPVGFNSGELFLELRPPAGTIAFGGLKLTWQMEPCLKPTCRLPSRTKCCEYFDADQVGSRILVRHWRPGDRFRPIGMNCPVKVQDLLTNQKISRERRRQLVMALTAGGEIFWVEGLRIAEQFKLTDRTVQRLRWSWVRS
jgi:tRNA(Ile)-lysidine synthase